MTKSFLDYLDFWFIIGLFYGFYDWKIALPNYSYSIFLFPIMQIIPKEALRTSAESYGGLTEPPFPSPQ